MNDERFDEFVRGQLRGYREPPEVPRDDMWEAIAARRRDGRRSRRPSWRYWGIGVAAALAIGVGIGRMSAPAGMDTPSATASTTDMPQRVPVAYQMATTELLERAEVFLTGFQSDVRGGLLVATEPTARDLLATTRLLLDSPVGEDVSLQALLEDIELVLAQIAGYADRPHSGELDLIGQSIEQQSVLFRLRSRVEQQSAGMPTQGAL
jgi:hypothetical protein